MARDPAGGDPGAASHGVAPRSAVARWLAGHRWIPPVIIVALAGAIAALLVLSLSGSSTSSAPSGPSVGLRSSHLGPILVDGRGLTLYTYGHDKHNVSYCSEVCARVWPPATVAGPTTVASGVSQARLRTINRADHTRQLVYFGHPLYTFSEDTRPGQMGGQGFLGVWFAVSPSGLPVKQPGAAAPSSGY